MIEAESILTEDEEETGRSMELLRLLLAPKHDSARIIEVTNQLIDELNDPGCYMSDDAKKKARQKYLSIIKNENILIDKKRDKRIQERLSRRSQNDIV